MNNCLTILALISSLLILFWHPVQVSGFRLKPPSFEPLNCTKSYPANSCEFWVDGAAKTIVAYQGFYQKTLYSEIKVNKPSDDEELFVVGQWLFVFNHTDNSTFIATQYADFSGNGTWEIDFLYEQRQGNSVTLSPHYEVFKFSYFMQHQPSGVCFWLTDAGQVPFVLQYSFQLPVYPIHVGRMEFNWANQEVSLFNQKHVCTH